MPNPDFSETMLTPAAGCDSPPAEESGKHAKLLTSDATGEGALVVAKLTDLSNSGIVRNIFIVCRHCNLFQMCRYLLILFVCEYR